MLFYDLSSTRIARSEPCLRPPNEAERLALLVALMMVEHCPFADLDYRSLVLSRDNREAVAQLMRRELNILSLAFADESAMEARLDELLGMRVTCGW